VLRQHSQQGRRRLAVEARAFVVVPGELAKALHGSRPRRLGCQWHPWGRERQ